MLSIDIFYKLTHSLRGEITWERMDIIPHSLRYITFVSSSEVFYYLKYVSLFYKKSAPCRYKMFIPDVEFKVPTALLMSETSADVPLKEVFPSTLWFEDLLFYQASFVMSILCMWRRRTLNLCKLAPTGFGSRYLLVIHLY